MGGPAYFVVAASPYWQVSKTRRAASRLAARSTQRVPSRSGHRAGDVAQHVADLVADGAHRRDGGDRDQRGDQHVLDGGGAIIVLHQLAENGQHGNLQKNLLGQVTLASRMSGRQWTRTRTIEARARMSSRIFVFLVSPGTE